MAAIFKVDFRGLDGIAKNILAVRNGFPEWAAAANAETAEEIRSLAQRNIREIDAIATGKMQAGVEVTYSKAGLVYAVGTKAAYGPFVELGTRPHFPPLDAIREWCRVRGIDEKAAFPIARAISRRGLPERPWLRPAFLAGIVQHANRIRIAVNDGLRSKLA